MEKCKIYLLQVYVLSAMIAFQIILTIIAPVPDFWFYKVHQDSVLQGNHIKFNMSKNKSN